MKTWNNYKNHVNQIDPEISKDIREIEKVATIIIATIEPWNILNPALRNIYLTT